MKLLSLAPALERRPVHPLSMTAGLSMANTPADSAALRTKQAVSPRFQSTEAISGWLFRRLPTPVDLRAGGFTLEDWTTRLMLWTLYIPQGIMAIKYNQHPWEVWGRNIIFWTSQLVIMSLDRHPKYGFKGLLNTFMRPKTPSLETSASWLDKLTHRYRLPANYLEIAQKAGVKLGPLHVEKGDLVKATEKTVWSKLKANELNMMGLYQKRLLKAAEQLSGSAKAAKLAEAKLVDRVLKRISKLHYTSFLFSTLLVAIINGIYLQKAVFIFLGPLDKKYKPKLNLKVDWDKLSSNGTSAAQHVPSRGQPASAGGQH